MNRRQRKSMIGYVIMVMGIVLITGTTIAWIIFRAADQIAIYQLPEASEPIDLPLADAAAIPTTAPIATVEPTPIFLFDPIEAEIPLVVEADPEMAIPTIDFNDLPSIASAEDAPRALREPMIGQPTHIVIPAIGVEAAVRDVGLSSVAAGGDIFYQWQVPHAYAVGWHHTSAPLGMPGNTVLNGHHNVYGEVFRDLDELSVGDGIILRDGERNYVYTVTHMEILPERGQSAVVRTNNSQWIQQTTDERLTLVTCWPYSDNSHRLVVVAKPVDG